MSVNWRHIRPPGYFLIKKFCGNTPEIPIPAILGLSCALHVPTREER
jgi:hypothetical protein